ncbi:MAG: PTS system mannose/fructose/sorbose family transporter subunit IID [Candidatus Krumholzibacteriia bacterium]
METGRRVPGDGEQAGRNDAPTSLPVAALEPRVRLAVYLRSLALQASWNPQRMQNLGLLATLTPWLRRQNVSLDERRLFCRRHYEFFNTNPYLANFVIGGILRLESDRIGRGRPAPPAIRVFRDSLARTFAGLGDQLFWLGLRPALILLMAVLVLLGWPWAALAAAAAGAVGQFELRRRALASGFARGFDLVEVLGHPGWHRAIAASKNTGKVLTGAVAGCFFARILAPGSLESIGPALALAAGAVVTPAMRRRLPGEVFLLLAATAVVALAFVL